MELKIEGINYKIDFKGFHEVLKFITQNRCYEFQPLTLIEYIKTISVSIKQIGNDLALDKDIFAKSILSYNRIDEEHNINELSPIALWWGCGGIEKIDISQGTDNWYNFGSIQIQLMPIPYQLRGRIFNTYITKQGRFYLIDYTGLLQSIIDCSVQAIKPVDRTIDTLDSYWSRGLIEKVMEINFINNDFYNKLQPFIEKGSYCFVENILEICKAMGWTPEKIFNTPAKEIDAILTLLEMAEKKKFYIDYNKTVMPQSNLLSHADTTIIKIEDD